MNEKLEAALTDANIEISKFDESKKKKVYVAADRAYTVEDFAEQFRRRLGKKFRDHVDIVEVSHDEHEFEFILRQFAIDKGIRRGAGVLTDDKDMANYVLNVDMGTDPVKFFITKDEKLSKVTGAAYIAATHMKHEDAISEARKVFREYDPYGGAGVRQVEHTNETLSYFNVYVPPPWRDHPNFNLKNPKIPVLFRKMLFHVFPDKHERTYFYAWLYMSLFKRAPTYLVLNGNPGLGKNRVKLLMRALHGHTNCPDGKRHMITEKFNSQIQDSTLLFFDELKYDEDVENTMKELTNNTMSVERKGVDATNSTRIFCSLAIANNYPRDNYIQFDARKFVPLVLNPLPLGKSMTDAEITKLNSMIEFENDKSFDIAALAQFAKWLKCYGPGYAAKFPNMEYKGPKFYYLAHTSMSKWQNAVVAFFYLTKHQFGIDGASKDGYLWSSLEARVKKTQGLAKSHTWPHVETIKRFVSIYCDLNGHKAFKIKSLQGISGDFYIKPLLQKIEIIEQINEDEVDLL